MTLVHLDPRYKNIHAARVVCISWKMKRMSCIFHNDNLRMRVMRAYLTNKSHSAGSCSCTTGAFHGQEIPSKSKQTGGGPALARHLRFRKGRCFIYRNFRRGTWRGTRGITRVPCAWAARSRVNYLDKSAWPPVRAMTVRRRAKLGCRFRSEGESDECTLLLTIMR